MRTAFAWILVAGLVGCSNSVDSLVVVQVTSDAPVDGVAAFAVAVTANSKTASFRITPPGGAATFDLGAAGQSFGIDLPKGISGPLHVHVDAVDASASTLAAGDGDTTIKAGSRVDLPLKLLLNGGPPATDDMGTDGGSDMGPSSDGPVLAIDRTSQTFGKVTVNQSSAAVAIAVKNNGGQPSSAITFTPSGANLDQFVLNSDCGAILLPGQSCHVNATFKPTTAGDKVARIRRLGHSGRDGRRGFVRYRHPPGNSVDHCGRACQRRLRRRAPRLDEHDGCDLYRQERRHERDRNAIGDDE